ncbi:MAG: bifunctional proline dehydrogenase/L-glutamate gamma-semialdehyde dehydrogenase PutA [Wenzhouxiangellaceae bacterium]|nr:bifunctional proline dehydrogenase/L-glutamate gamma-semialdehyde dehydrogenase PutA [Wenzhouxiangellaceae bacterium]MBS3746201.1 bifunctional proline dehydrogenase/L-glutamate gamma-semialdehyde dehydrogenase PutA [Wenzhouxiangellaceae bacterium]MBS3822587.1 bifunctional proline dehydrogenase/L-glutamate gamma-semialdehyde dehydrogenase PutA [Wenzhouxiangellaceae bacterium]
MSQKQPFVTRAEFPGDAPRRALEHAWAAPESDQVPQLLEAVGLDKAERTRIEGLAVDLVERVRRRSEHQGAMEAFMREYDLSSEEGVVLMCLAEALLRIPDNDTAEKLISDKLSEANWESHLGKSESLFVNASTWGLMLTGRMVRVGQSAKRDVRSVLARLANKSGEPVVRLAIRQAMRIMGHQYVMGRDIESAMERSRKKSNRRYRYSFDMLGEAALTADDARRYRDSYASAIDAIGKVAAGSDIFDAPSISVKLSALHPRYETAQRERVMAELVPTLSDLAVRAREAGIALTVDAEEAARLMLQLDVFAAVLADDRLAGWDGFGLALQAYLRRGWTAIDWLAELARNTGHRIPIRLVKGAYWDTEIKLAQVEGHADYPVFTRKPNTDVSFLACARHLLEQRDAFYPQFASHNAHTICALNQLAGDREDFEYQRLHGMGEDMYEEVLDSGEFNGHCRVYAPVGDHRDLLPYLVRRLLENGANSSFVNRIVDERLPPREVVSDPIELVERFEQFSHPRIPLPKDIFGGQRRNSGGINFAAETEQLRLAEQMSAFRSNQWKAGPAGSSQLKAAETQEVRSPADREDVVGSVASADPECAGKAVDAALAAQPAWDATPAEQRAQCLERMADLLEENRAELMALCTREAGKSLIDGINEVREAADFCRYYAQMARRHFAQPEVLPGPTGEHNEISLHGKGVFVCISPWNFPVAIFTGQVAAALVSGNAAIAKPAEQTPLLAARAVELFLEAGIPRGVLQLLPGDGRVGAALTSDPRIAGVAFTGSTETAHIINRTLAEREGPLATLIAETGGQNAMIVDSSALAEQVVRDVIHSAFLSAGQRCSALRVLYLQHDVADHMLDMLSGAMRQLAVGWPGLLSTDIGPVIDQVQLEMLERHAARMEREARPIARVPEPQGSEAGFWFAPRAYEIDSMDQLDGEVFGPVLHVVRYRARDLDRVIDQINATGYGLTAGCHSRIDKVQQHVIQRIHAGNAYVNRNMTGAVVGVQPFGGEGLSGTGPKAGGPNYLQRFAVERTRTINTAAVGGNASLMVLSD